jgi:D-proline reductase (dithiol) PrdB
VSLTARHLEANGMPTVILGSARDIVEHCGAPRFVFSDFPLGNSAGLPFERDMQRRIVELGLELLESARQPRTTLQTPFVWSGDPDWRDSFSRVDDTNRERLKRKGSERRVQRKRDRIEGRVRAE